MDFAIGDLANAANSFYPSNAATMAFAAPFDRGGSTMEYQQDSNSNELRQPLDLDDIAMTKSCRISSNNQNLPDGFQTESSSTLRSDPHRAVLSPSLPAFSGGQGGGGGGYVDMASSTAVLGAEVKENLLDISPDYICILTPRARIVQVSSQFQRLMPDMNVQDFEKQPFAHFLHPYDQAPLVAGLRKILLDDSSEMILRVQSPSGQFLWADFQGHLISDRRQKYILLHGRPRSPLESLVALQSISLTTRATKMICMLVSRTGLILSSSDAAQALFGLQDDHPDPYSFSKVCPDLPHAPMIEIFNHLRDGPRDCICVDHAIRSLSGRVFGSHTTFMLTPLGTIFALFNKSARPRAHQDEFHVRPWIETPERNQRPREGLSPRRMSIAQKLNCGCTHQDQVQAQDPGPKKLDPNTSVAALVAIHELHQQNKTMAREEMQLEQAKYKRRKHARRMALGPKGGCTMCGNTNTPEWRRGLDGLKTLCNRCGLRVAKEVKLNVKKEDADMKDEDDDNIHNDDDDDHDDDDDDHGGSEDEET